MTPDAHVIHQGPYFRDLLDQPRALRDTIESLARTRAPEMIRGLGSGPARRVVLTGMGSSLHALYGLHLRFVALGVSSFHVETAELLDSQPALLAGAEVVIVVSQSGASAEIVKVVERLPDRSRLVAITNTSGSLLARAAGAVVMMRAGEEATVSCKTYLATLAALGWLGAASEGDDTIRGFQAEARRSTDAVEACLASGVAQLGDWFPLLQGIRNLFVVGRGTSLSAVWTGALINKEAAGVSVEGMSSAAFRHGPFEMAGPETLVLVLEGAPEVADLNRRLVDHVRGAGGRAELIGPGASSPVLRLPALSERTRPFVEILPLQTMSLALAAREGREAGRFERATKVTVVR
jgi:glucosamine--fructose-6-phosphate aminotransferase (isomerizing)